MENKRLVGKYVKIFYDDLGHVSCKEGICTTNSDAEIEIDYKIIIPKTRLIRVEVGKNGIIRKEEEKEGRSGWGAEER